LEPEAFSRVLLQIIHNSSQKYDHAVSLGQIISGASPPELNSSFFNVNTGLLFTTLGLQQLVTQSGISDILDTKGIQSHLKSFYKPFNISVEKIISPTKVIDNARMIRLLYAFVKNGRNDPEMEICFMEMSRIFPFGVLLPLLLALVDVVKLSFPWPDMFFKDIENDEDVVCRRLPAPEPGTKYYIFSDIHRDQASDDQGAFEFGSIDHFSTNRELYSKILEHALDDNWTVIEVGDCEELWYIRDFQEFREKGQFKGMLAEIIDTNKGIYQQLARLHHKNRYFRVFGNHDSEVRKPALFKLLKDCFADQKLKFYDYLIIPAIKTMDEHDYIDLCCDIVKGLKTENPIRNILKNASEGRLGLDAEPYKSKKPMIIAHGHQWDFWNCDKNALIGKMMSNSLGVWADSINDPFCDLGGLAAGGSPIFKFTNLFSKLPVFNNFISESPARNIAMKIQFEADGNRLMVDDICYSETITALMGMLATPLNAIQPDGRIRTWQETLQDIRKKKIPWKKIYQPLCEHLFNHICIGHTHFPQSQPYFDIECWVASSLLKPVIGNRIDKLLDKGEKELFGYRPSLNLWKSYYHNTGTTGWMEGVIWAIRIDETGQARLVYWTRNTLVDQPFEMTWDLPLMDAKLRKKLAEKKEQLFD